MTQRFRAGVPTAPNIPENEGKTIEYRDYIEGSRQILTDSQKETGPYEISVLGQAFIVFPNVFSPKYFNDSELFAANLPIRAGDVALEIGPGTGVIAVTAILRGAERVVAVDINPDAVKNTLENARRHGLENKIDVRLGDLYSPLRPDEKFDVIFWNTPFGYVEEENLSDLEKSLWDTGYKATERFIKEAQAHLNVGGRLYIGFSTTLGKYDVLERIAHEAGYELRILYQVESTEVHPVTFEIIEAIARPR